MTNFAKHNLYIDASPITTLKVSGIGHMLSNLVRAMGEDEEMKRDYQVILFGPKRAKKIIDEWGFENVIYKSHGLPQKLITAMNLFRILPPVNLWLGNGVYLFANYSNYPLTRKSKSLTYVLDLCYLSNPELVKTKVRNILKKNVPTWIKRTDKIIAISDFTKNELQKYYKISEQKISIVPCGIDPIEFYPRPEAEIGDIKKKYNLPEKYILFLSNIEPRKNLERLISAHIGLPLNLRKDYPLLIVGNESWMNEGIDKMLIKAEQNADKIYKPNRRIDDEDIPALQSGARILVHPAIYEGFGISPLQALACGTPVVVSGAASMPEVMGDAALYINPFDEEDIKGRIQEMLTNPKLRATKVEKGLSRVKQYTWAISVKKLKKAIDSQL